MRSKERNLSPKLIPESDCDSVVARAGLVPEVPVLLGLLGVVAEDKRAARSHGPRPPERIKEGSPLGDRGSLQRWSYGDCISSASPKGDPFFCIPDSGSCEWSVCSWDSDRCTISR